MEERPRYDLKDVFNESTVPTVTYVEPAEARHIRASLATTNKHVTLIGPSGSGKTTLVSRSLEEMDVPPHEWLLLSGRKYAQASSILDVFGEEFGEAPEFDPITRWLASVQYIVLDDVHHLGAGALSELGRLLKYWHEQAVRFVLIGIAGSSESLVGQDPELSIRNDVFELGVQSPEFCRELIGQGEGALNFEFEDTGRGRIVEASQGIPSVVQAICRVACIEADIPSTRDEFQTIQVDLAAIRESVLRMYHPRFFERVVGLAKGRRQARSVLDTYFDIVEELARSRESEVSRETLYRNIVGPIEDPDAKRRKSSSFYNCLRNLSKVIEEKGLSDVLLYNETSGTISIEDPTFRFYLNLLNLDEVKSRIRIRRLRYEWDVAVSFAGPDRDRVIEVVRAMEDRGLLVFYDFDREAELWGKDLRKVLREVYANEAQFMMVFLSEHYPERDWPTFEFEVGKDAADKRTDEYLLPVLVGEELPHIVGLPDTTARVGLATHTPEQIADLMAEKFEAVSGQAAS